MMSGLGVPVLLGNTAVSASSTTQYCVTLSTSETEYVAMAIIRENYVLPGSNYGGVGFCSSTSQWQYLGGILTATKTLMGTFIFCGDLRLCSM